MPRVTRITSYSGRARIPSQVWLQHVANYKKCRILNWEFRKRKDKVGGSIIQSFAKPLGR